MGRHATPSPDAARPLRERVRRHVVVWLERLALGLAAGGVTLGVLRWAGTSWTATLWASAGAVVVVLAATWLATTVPGHPDRRP